jgi:hypothetical protein
MRYRTLGIGAAVAAPAVVMASLARIAHIRFGSDEGLRVYLQALGFFNHMILTIWSASLCAVFYRDMRIRLEAFDLTQLAKSEEPVATGARSLETPPGRT